MTAGTASSSATIPIPSTLASGSYTIRVTYGGDGNYGVTSTATTIPLSVGQITPTISWSPGTTAITYGATSGGILDASALNGTTAVPGTFTYTATLSGGVAVAVTSASVLGAGSYTLTATFTPTDTTVYKTVSATATLTVNQASQTISFTPPASPVTYGVSPITLAVSAGSSGNAVTFTVTGPATLSGNTLTITGAGTVRVTANQAGNANYTAATSVTQTIVITQASASVSLVASANPVLVTNAVTFTATVASAAGTPTGSVSFFDGTTLLGTVVLSSGVASYTTSSLAAATHSITAVYSGSSNSVSGTSSALAEVVQDYSLSIPGSPRQRRRRRFADGGSWRYSYVHSGAWPVQRCNLPGARHFDAERPASRSNRKHNSEYAAGWFLTHQRDLEHPAAAGDGEPRQISKLPIGIYRLSFGDFCCCPSPAECGAPVSGSAGRFRCCC